MILINRETVYQESKHILNEVLLFFKLQILSALVHQMDSDVRKSLETYLNICRLMTAILNGWPLEGMLLAVKIEPS